MDRRSFFQTIAGAALPIAISASASLAQAQSQVVGPVFDNPGERLVQAAADYVAAYIGEGLVGAQVFLTPSFQPHGLSFLIPDGIVLNQHVAIPTYLNQRILRENEDGSLEFDATLLAAEMRPVAVAMLDKMESYFQEKGIAGSPRVVMSRLSEIHTEGEIGKNGLHSHATVRSTLSFDVSRLSMVMTTEMLFGAA